MVPLLIPTISTKFKSNVLIIENTRVNSLVDIRVIRAIQYKLFILAYETILVLHIQEKCSCACRIQCVYTVISYTFL